MNRRIALSSLLAGTVTAVSAPVAFGAADWCESDPLIEIKTPTGLVLPVHVTNYALGDHDEALKIVEANPVAPYITYTVKQRGGASVDKRAPRAVTWQVTIFVTIPGLNIPGDAPETRFRTKTIASSLEFGKGVVYAQSQGWSNAPMPLRFDIVA
ncbi:MAG TPA: hypothetical protein VFN74_23445 [Chloroflexota bacterium]|jgi:hypothetical protein|nr:hypothetical protein [Chloroflexota bacterium]